MEIVAAYLTGPAGQNYPSPRWRSSRRSSISQHVFVVGHWVYVVASVRSCRITYEKLLFQALPFHDAARMRIEIKSRLPRGQACGKYPTSPATRRRRLPRLPRPPSRQCSTRQAMETFARVWCLESEDGICSYCVCGLSTV